MFLLLFFTAHLRCSILISNYIQTYWQNAWISRFLVFRFATVHFLDTIWSFSFAFDWVPVASMGNRLSQLNGKKGSSWLASRNRNGAVQRVLENNILASATTMKRIVKRSLTGIFCQTNFLPHNRYFQDRNVGGWAPQFSFRGLQPPLPLPLPLCRLWNVTHDRVFLTNFKVLGNVFDIFSQSNLKQRRKQRN